jgi:hypothetical protein
MADSGRHATLLQARARYRLLRLIERRVADAVAALDSTLLAMHRRY